MYTITIFRTGIRARGLLRACLFLALLFTTPYMLGQDPLRFEKELENLELRTDSLWDPSRQTIVFTGSSSIRMWTSLSEDFPGAQVINTGFGGSQASDLLHYLQPLVTKFRPVQVFIYEGDNDLAEGKRPRRVLKTLQEVSARIREACPGVTQVWIAAKPSISRWNLRGKYRRFNRKLRRKAGKIMDVRYADVWHPMLNGRQLKTELFIEDGLHMNAAGYKIWREVLGPELITTPSTR